MTTFGLAWLVVGLALLTVLLIEKVRKMQTPRTAQWNGYLIGALVWIALGVFAVLRGKP